MRVSFEATDTSRDLPIFCGKPSRDKEDLIVAMNRHVFVFEIDSNTTDSKSKSFRRPVHMDMCTTCRSAAPIAKTIQLRHVPDELNRKLKARAAMEGLSLSDYLLQEVERIAERPTLADLRRRLAHRESVRPRVPSAKAARPERQRQ